VQFTDLSILPNFSTGIAALNGTVLGLSSAPGSRAHIDLKGQVDQFTGAIAGVVIPITFISLLVGGIVVMNMMLFSVTSAHEVSQGQRPALSTLPRSDGDVECIAVDRA